MAISPEYSFSFSEEDLEIFSKASGDRNPFHLSPAYAARTPYGQRVVFGCLGAIACLGKVPLPAGQVVTWLQAEFLRPMFLGVNYGVTVSEKEGEWTARLFDGSVPVVALRIKTAALLEICDTEALTAPLTGYGEALVRKAEDITVGTKTSGDYACDPAALTTLAQRWRVEPFVAMNLGWSSYLIGMELPGESALFSKVTLDFGKTRTVSPFSYHATVDSIDTRFQQIKISASSPVVAAQFWSYIRQTLPDIQENIDSNATDSLVGRTAVLIGASRGLGAAIKRALESRGAVVYSLSRSAGGASSNTVTGDATDPEALQRLRQRVLEEKGKLDFLICNASPPLLPLRLELNAIERVGTYVNDAVAITLTPLCAFLSLLNDSGGCAVLISSFAVEEPVREWPHYLAAKQAVEMLGRVSVLQYPRTSTLIVRPQKMLTTMTNTPMGRAGAGSPEAFAARLAGRLENPFASGKVEIFS